MSVNPCSDQASQTYVLQAALAQSLEGSEVTEMYVTLLVKAPQPAGGTDVFLSMRKKTMNRHPVGEAVVVDPSIR